MSKWSRKYRRAARSYLRFHVLQKVWIGLADEVQVFLIETGLFFLTLPPSLASCLAAFFALFHFVLVDDKSFPHLHRRVKPVSQCMDEDVVP